MQSFTSWLQYCIKNCRQICSRTMAKLMCFSSISATVFRNIASKLGKRIVFYCSSDIKFDCFTTRIFRNRQELQKYLIGFVAFLPWICYIVTFKCAKLLGESEIAAKCYCDPLSNWLCSVVCTTVAKFWFIGCWLRHCGKLCCCFILF